MSVSFPQYRKNRTEKSFFQINSTLHVVEWQQLGNRWIRHEIHAIILPERLLIADMISCENGHYTIINEEEFQLATQHAS